MHFNPLILKHLFFSCILIHIAWLPHIFYDAHTCTQPSLTQQRFTAGIWQSSSGFRPQVVNQTISSSHHDIRANCPHAAQLTFPWQCRKDSFFLFPSVTTWKQNNNNSTSGQFYLEFGNSDPFIFVTERQILSFEQKTSGFSKRSLLTTPVTCSLQSFSSIYICCLRYHMFYVCAECHMLGVLWSHYMFL